MSIPLREGVDKRNSFRIEDEGLFLAPFYLLNSL